VKRSGFRVRAVHVICTALILIGVASMACGLKLAPPVPLDGKSQTATWIAVLMLSGLIAGLTTWRVKPLSDRLTVFLIAAFLLPVLGATAIPDLLCALNAAGTPAAESQHLERLVELKHESLGKHRERQVLITRSMDGQSLRQREISPTQFRALQTHAWTLHQPLSIEVAEGLLGWRFVRAVKDASSLAQ
jgi:hypothetical protein